MKKFARPLAFALAALMAVPAMQSQALADTKYKINLNGRVLTTQNQIQNISDRILLPYREIGEAMGATVEWYEPERKVMAFRGNRYSFMNIGSSVVTYGEFTIDSLGYKQYTSEKTEFLPVAPVIINNWTYIPVRSIAETLGATVSWDAATNTAYITANAVADPVPPEPEVEIPDNYGDFSNTSYFRIISSSAIKEMYQDSNKYPFIFVLYDSSEESSKMMVPNIQDAAQDEKYRIYGVDMNDSNNKASDNNWLWNGFFREREFKDPTVYFVKSKSDVTQMQAPTDMDKLQKEIAKFATVASTEYDYADFDDTTYFKSKSDTTIQKEYNNKNEFIVVLYDRTDEDSKQYIPVIKAAAKEKKALVYGLDIDKYPNFYKNVDFLKNYRYDATDELPVMFLMYKDKDDMETYKQPKTLEKVKSIIDEFNNHKSTSSSSRYDDIKNSILNNASIEQLDEYYRDNESFIVVLYDSSDKDSQEDVERIADILRTDDRFSYTRFYYGLNISSNTHDNSDWEDYDWLLDKAPSTSRFPALLYYKNGKYDSKLSDATSTSDIESFLKSKEK